MADCRMASAARQAARGWSSRLSNAPKPERIPSPLTSMTVPPCSRTAAAMALITGPKRSMADSASIALIAWVDPFRSAKRTVAILREVWLAACPRGCNLAPHSLQNLAPCGLEDPQREQCSSRPAGIFLLSVSLRRVMLIASRRSQKETLRAKLVLRPRAQGKLFRVRDPRVHV